MSNNKISLIISLVILFIIFFLDHSYKPAYLEVLDQNNRYQNGYDLGGDSLQFSKCVELVKKITGFNVMPKPRLSPIEAECLDTYTGNCGFIRFPSVYHSNPLIRRTDKKLGLYIEDNNYVQIMNSVPVNDKEIFVAHVVLDNKSCGSWYVVKK